MINTILCNVFLLLICISLYQDASVSSELVTKYPGYGSKTPYYFVYPPDEKFRDDSLYNVETEKLTCGAVHLSAVIRHGARNPGEKDSRKITEVHNRIKDVINKDKFKSLMDWSNRFPHNNDKQLNDAGKEEQNQLSRRIGKKLKSLFMEEDISALRFVSSSAKRAEASAATFYEGFAEQLEMPKDATDDFDVEENDEYLRFHTLCKQYQNSVEKNKTATKEYDIFLSSDQMSKVLTKVTTKLDLEDNILKPSDLKTMIVICGSEMALYKTSPWCDLFDDEDVKTLEYLSDLKKYYKYGPAYKVTWEQSCPLVSELFTVMDDVILNMERTAEDKELEGFLIGNFMFGHAETLGPLYAALGLFNDSIPLLASNYDEQKSRQFRSSKILPFSANVMFILYECEENEELINDEEEYEHIHDDYLLQVLVNERPVILPGCKDVMCSYNEVRERYLELIDGCHFDDICGLNQNGHEHDEL